MTQAAPVANSDQRQIAIPCIGVIVGDRWGVRVGFMMLVSNAPVTAGAPPGWLVLTHGPHISPLRNLEAVISKQEQEAQFAAKRTGSVQRVWKCRHVSRPRCYKSSVPFFI